MSAKNCDSKNRFRSKVISFRMSPEEAKYLDKYVALSGLTKQDYIISKLLNRDVIVYGNPRVYKALKSTMSEILDELKIKNVNPDDELTDLIKFISKMMEQLKEEYEIEF